MIRQDLQKAFSEIEEEAPELNVAYDVPLARYTTFGIGGPADVLCFANETDQVLYLLRACRDRGLPTIFLGGGSNVLIGDAGVRAVVIRLAGKLCEISVRDGGAEIVVGAGAKFGRLTKTAIGLGWSSAVGWMGTPGQVGGALKMNAGTRDGEIGDVVHSVTAVSDEGVRVIAAADAGFEYRKSSFPPDSVLTEACLRCESHSTDLAMDLDRKAKMLLQKRHKSQPKLRSAGSIFKNPTGDYAGRLIEAAGLKGRVVGDAMISETHANFIVNRGQALAADVLRLAEEIQAAVKKQFGIDLEWEVKRVGEFS